MGIHGCSSFNRVLTDMRWRKSSISQFWNNYALNYLAYLRCCVQWKKKVATDTITSQETIQHNDESTCQTRSWLLTSPEEEHSESATNLSHSRICCLWASSWAGGHWDAGSAAGLAVRFPPRHSGSRGQRCSEIWAGQGLRPGLGLGQPAPPLLVSPFPLRRQGKRAKSKKDTAGAMADGEIITGMFLAQTILILFWKYLLPTVIFLLHLSTWIYNLSGYATAVQGKH